MQDQSPAAQDDDEEEDESWQPQSLSQPATYRYKYEVD
jgi:hypothetical protein